MVYSWKVYSYPVSADIAGQEIEKIEKEYGKVTSDLLLQRAEDEDNPLHQCFEWDDSVAAHKYRLHQATVLILNLSIEPEKTPKPMKMRAFYNVSENTKKGTFINAKTAFENPDTRSIVLQRALREFNSFREKYKNLSEFSQIFNIFDTMVSDMEDLDEVGEEE